ncbi:MAG: flagellar basal body rod protein FlgF, partial [Steroidobacteraceae bacterium]
LAQGPLVRAALLRIAAREHGVGINGQGWFAVQAADGREAYTRAGDLRVDPSGILMTGAGHPVLGDSGPVSVPPNSSVLVGADGTVSIVPLGQGPDTTAAVGRLKLVKPPLDQLERGEDGLFRIRDGSDAPADASVRVASGVLESSNVNIADAMVNMIELSRQFDLQVKAMRTAEDDAAAASQLLRT